MHRLLLAGVAVVSVLLPTRPVEGCVCLPTYLDREWIAPLDGDMKVPLNTRIWVSRGSLDTVDPAVIRVETSAGSPVAGSWKPLEGTTDWLWVFRPEVDLLALTNYRVRTPDGTVVTFETGTEPDLDPPSAPVEEARDPVVQYSDGADTCSSDDAYAWIDLDHDGQVAVLDRAETVAMDLAHPSGSATDVTIGRRAVVGKGLCVTSNWPTAAPSATTTLRYGAFDLAGNFSGWSEETELTLPGCACNSSTGGPSTAVPFLLLGFWLRPRPAP